MLRQELRAQRVRFRPGSRGSGSRSVMDELDHTDTNTTSYIPLSNMNYNSPYSHVSPPPPFVEIGANDTK